jgi:hypothetical protein
MNRQLYFAASLGTLGGFAGGAFVTGAWLATVGAIVVAVWSLIVGVQIVAPLAGKYGAQRLVNRFKNPTEEEAAENRQVAVGIAHDMAIEFDAEMGASAESPKPVLALVNRFTQAFTMSVRGQAAVLKRELDQGVGETIGGTGDESYTAKLAQLKAAAKKAGRVIPEKLEGTADTLAFFGDLLGQLGGGKGESKPATKGKRTGPDGYI